jgi:uncharacterized protein (DUF1778 family)
MATKIDRVEARVAHDQRERIEQAAKLTNTSLSSFMVTAAQEKAERVFAESRTTLVPPDFFDALVAALDEPGVPLPRLSKAAENARDIVTHR